MNSLAEESGLDPRTIKRFLADTKSDRRGRYTFADLVTAIRSKADVRTELERERLRKTTAEADGIELENRRKLGELVDVAVFVRDYHKTLVAMRQVVMNSKLTESSKHDILESLEHLQTDDNPKPKRPKRKAKAK